MFFGGNKNINKKLGAFVIALVFVFGVFQVFDFANAQSENLGFDVFFGLPNGQKLIELEACEGDGGSYEDKSNCRMSENVYNAVIDTDIVKDIINEDISIEDIPTEEQNNNLLTTNFQDLTLKEKLTELEACEGDGGSYEDKSNCRMSENVYNAAKELGEEELQKEQRSNSDNCPRLDFGCHFKNAIFHIMGSAANAFLEGAGLFLRFTGILLNQVVSITIEGMNTFLNDNGDSIKNAWSIIRDIINILFIFGLLFVSLSTIIRGIGQKTKQLLVTIIASALLINFSYLFTAVLIDVSNFLTIEIKNNISTCEKSENSVVALRDSILAIADGGISNCVMDKVKLQSVFHNRENGFLNAINPNEEGFLGGIFKVMISALFGSIFITITGLVFLLLAILLAIRFIKLIFLLITSPVLFLGWVLPQLSGISKRWTKSLGEQLLFPPLVFLFIYISLSIADTTNLIDTTFFGIILNYILIMGFMIGSIVIAQKTGATGANFATKVAGTASIGLAARGTGSFGRRFIGRPAANWADKIDGTTKRGQLLKGAIKGVADRSFDVRNTKSFEGIAKATGLTGATGTPITKGYRDRAEEKANKEKERYDNAKKQTESEARKIEGNLKHIQDSEAQRKEDGVGENRLKVIEDSKKEITEDRQNLANINNQIRAAKGTPEEKELQTKAKAINKKITQTQQTIDKSEKELNEAYEPQFQAIKDIEKQAKDRAKAVEKQVRGRTEGVLGKVSAVFGSSSNLASRKIADSARKKDDKDGTLLTMTKNYKKPEDRKGRYDEQEKQVREEEARNEVARKNKPEGGVDDDFYENGGTTGI